MTQPLKKTSEQQQAFLEIWKQKALVKEKIREESGRIRMYASELIGPFEKKQPETPLQAITHKISEMSYTFRIVKACFSLLSHLHRF